MARKYSVFFLILAGLLGTQAAMCIGSWFWASLILFYASMSFGLLAIAYAGLGAKVFFKSKSGKLNPASFLMFGPYLLMNAVVFRIYKRATAEPAFALVSPNLYFGRRLTNSEATHCTAVTWQGVLDLAGEFSEIEALRKLPGYRSLPVLDGTAPSPEELQDAVSWIEKGASRGRVYVHCALGHGRSACVVVAYLLATGEANSPDEAISRLQELRPGIRLNFAQLEAAKFYQGVRKPSV